MACQPFPGSFPPSCSISQDVASLLLTSMKVLVFLHGINTRKCSTSNSVNPSHSATDLLGQVVPINLFRSCTYLTPFCASISPRCLSVLLQGPQKVLYGQKRPFSGSWLSFEILAIWLRLVHCVKWLRRLLELFLYAPSLPQSKDYIVSAVMKVLK